MIHRSMDENKKLRNFSLPRLKKIFLKIDRNGLYMSQRKRGNEKRRSKFYNCGEKKNSFRGRKRRIGTFFRFFFAFWQRDENVFIHLKSFRPRNVRKKDTEEKVSKEVRQRRHLKTYKRFQYNNIDTLNAAFDLWQWRRRSLIFFLLLLLHGPSTRNGVN